jgi:hypothetical protein
VQPRDPEDRHDRVADELLDHPALALHGPLHRLELAGHDAPGGLGLQAFAQLRRSATSQNTTVTVLRTSRGGATGSSGAAQSRQNLARSGFFWPQREHVGMAG